MAKSTTPSSVLTLPIDCEPWQQDFLDKLFRVSTNMYNNLVADRLNALKRLKHTKAWRTVQTDLSNLYEQQKKNFNAAGTSPFRKS